MAPSVVYTSKFEDFKHNIFLTIFNRNRGKIYFTVLKCKLCRMYHTRVWIAVNIAINVNCLKYHDNTIFKIHKIFRYRNSSFTCFKYHYFLNLFQNCYKLKKVPCINFLTRAISTTRWQYLLRHVTCTNRAPRSGDWKKEKTDAGRIMSMNEAQS